MKYIVKRDISKLEKIKFHPYLFINKLKNDIKDLDFLLG